MNASIICLLLAVVGVSVRSDRCVQHECYNNNNNSENNSTKNDREHCFFFSLPLLSYFLCVHSSGRNKVSSKQQQVFFPYPSTLFSHSTLKLVVLDQHVYIYHK